MTGLLQPVSVKQPGVSFSGKTSMKVLVTGGNGQIGYELLTLLKGSDILHYAPARNQLDLTIPRQVEEVIAGYQPTIVVNAAGYRSPARAEIEPSRCFALNRDAPAALARICDQHKAVLIHISSWRVFDGTKQEAYTIKDIPNPSCVLGSSFWQGEQQVRENCSRHIILRLSWVISPRGRNRLTSILSSLVRGEPVLVSASSRGRPTPADDVARVILAIMRQIDCNAQVWGTCHYNSAETVDEESLAKVILAEASQYHDFPANTAALFPESNSNNRTVNACLDTTHLRNTFGIHSKFWHSGVARLVKDIYATDKNKREQEGRG